MAKKKMNSKNMTPAQIRREIERTASGRTEAQQKKIDAEREAKKKASSKKKSK